MDGSGSLSSQPDVTDMLPTPRATDGEKGGPNQRGSSGDYMLPAIGNLLPTPVAQASGNTPEDHLRKKPGRKVVTDLAILTENNLIASGGALLPTPSVADGTGGHERRGGARGDELLLPGVARELALLRTPCASETEGGPRNPDRPGSTMRLSDQVREELTMFPTPCARDWKDTGAPAEYARNTPPYPQKSLLLPTPVASEGLKATNRMTAKQKAVSGQVWLTNVAQTIAQEDFE
jgi:hypothetical protein